MRLVMINKIRIRNFKAHRDTTVSLGRLTMLVGDNASGKTSVLEALSLQSMLYPHLCRALQDDRTPVDLIRRGEDLLAIDSEGTRQGSPWEVRFRLSSLDSARNEWNAKFGVKVNGDSFERYDTFTYDDSRKSTAPGRFERSGDDFSSILDTAPLYKLHAKAIAAGSFRGRQTEPRFDEYGGNTAAVLADMKLDREEDFQQVEDALRRIVPAVQRVHLQPVPLRSAEGHKVFFDLHGAKSVPAHGAGHGTLIALGILTILYGPSRPKLVLLDDFDRGLHPRAQLELVKMIKGLLALEALADLQIVATAYSPYVLDKLSAEQVYVFAMGLDGTVASKRLSEHPAADRARGMVSSGQLWSMDPEQDWVLGG